MIKKTMIVSAMMAILLLAAGAVLAENDTEEHAAADYSGAQVWVFISSAFGMAIVSSFAAIAMGISVKSFSEGVSRNPTAADRLQMGFILTLVLIETLALYVLAVIFVKVNL